MTTPEKAMFHIPNGVGESILVVTDLVTVKIRCQDSAGAFALTEVLTQPQGGPPGLHRHPDQEIFYVLEGFYRFDTQQSDQLASIEAVCGSVVHIPGMVWHNYKNIGQTPGKMMVVLQPGSMIDFFRELGIVVSDNTNLPRPSGPPDMERVMAIAKKHHVEMLKECGKSQ